MDSRTTSAIFELILIVLLAGPGIYIITKPEKFLAKVGRPTTEKHIRASRLIGVLGLVAAMLTLFRWFRGT